MNVFYNCICIYHDFDATVGRKLGDNIVTVTNNVLHTFLKIFAVVKFVPGFPIIADTGKLIKNFRITKGTFLHEFCLGASTFSYTLTWACVLDCSTLRYLIKIFKMAAELCNRAYSRRGHDEQKARIGWQIYRKFARQYVSRDVT